jgi:N-sulfoglucosamine sulfohydrolase
MDPHKPFYAEGRSGETIDDPHQPSRVFKPEEVPIPGFLFDDPIVRKELAHYYSSVRRADDSVGAALAALKTAGETERTVVMFLSDHGMPLPFAKTQLYHHSTRTPWVVRWPGVTQSGAVDSQHMISAVDMLPTLLDIAGISQPNGLDGKSFAPLLKGEQQTDREMIVKEYNENSGGSRDPMRAIQTKKWLYVFNPWSSGERIMQTATTGTPTYRRFRELAQNDPALAARHKLYQFRVVEELYDVERDPDCVRNLIGDAKSTSERDGLRSALDQWMVKTSDPMLEVFRKRDDPAFREAYVRGQEREVEERRAYEGKKADKKGKRKAKAAGKAKGDC